MSRSEAALLVALDRGGLQYDRRKCGERGGPVWRFGGRFFRPRDVKLMIKRGVAVRVGTRIVKA